MLLWLVQYMRTMLVLVFSVKLVRNFSFGFLVFFFFNQCLLVYGCTGDYCFALSALWLVCIYFGLCYKCINKANRSVRLYLIHG